MNKEFKFKVGDFVRCIEGGRQGGGWKLGLKFIIIDITSYPHGNVYFGGEHGLGVWEESLILNKSLNGD